MWHALKNLVGARRPERSPSAASSPKADNDWWRTVRRPASADDAAPSAAALAWLRDTPPHARPALLCERHPRVVNRLATLRGDPQRLLSALEGLLVDERGGRAGFVPMIRAEIARLCHLHRGYAMLEQARARDLDRHHASRPMAGGPSTAPMPARPRVGWRRTGTASSASQPFFAPDLPDDGGRDLPAGGVPSSTVR